MSSQEIKAQRYWKDVSHWYQVINKHSLITLFINDDSTDARIERMYFLKTNFVMAEIMKKDNHDYIKSSKSEFNIAYKKALKIINA